MGKQAQRTHDKELIKKTSRLLKHERLNEKLVTSFTT